MTKPLLVSPLFFDRCRRFLTHLTSPELARDTAGDLKVRVRAIFEGTTNYPNLPMPRYRPELARLSLETHREFLADSVMALADKPSLQRRRQMIDAAFTFANRPDREPSS